MKCFYHQDRDAVALCKSCHRALCPDCVADVPPGSACRGRCEQEVAAVNLMLERGKSAYLKAGNAYRRNAIAFLIMGLVMVAFGLLPLVTNGDKGALFLAVFGGFFLLLSFFSFRSGKQIEQVSR